MTVRNWSTCFMALLAWHLLPCQAGAQDGVAPPDPAALRPVNPLADIPIATVASFLDRPLFVASRRAATALPAPVAVQVAPSVAAPSAANLRLLGTITTAMGASALIQHTGSGTTTTVGNGEAIDRWRITEIQASKVRLEGDGQSIWLEIFGPSAPPSAAASSLPATGSNQAPIVPSVVPPSAPPQSSAGSAAPAGTTAGTAAAVAARNSPYQLTFGTAAPQTAD